MLLQPLAQHLVMLSDIGQVRPRRTSDTLRDPTAWVVFFLQPSSSEGKSEYEEGNYD